VLVDAECVATGQLDPIHHRRLVAWRKGRLRVGQAGVRVLSLRVKRVVQGKLAAAHVSPPVGVGLVEVMALDDAAFSGVGMGARGRWRLRGLPDGTWYVAAASDVPASTKVASTRLKTHRTRLAMIRRQLASNKPAVRYRGMLGLSEHDIKYFALVPALLGSLDSKAKVVNPRGMHFHGKGGGGHVPVTLTMGKGSRQVLVSMVRPLLTRDSPGEQDSAQTWRAWWRGVMGTPPFPKTKMTPGPLSTLTPVPQNQTWPQLVADPGGSAVLVVLTRAHTPVLGARNVILHLPLTPPRAARAVYTVPRGSRAEPRGARAAWGPKGAGLVWFEERSAGRKSKKLELFLALSAAGKPRHKPVNLRLASTGHMALSPLGRGWMVVYESRADHAFYLQRVSGKGRRLGRAQRLTKPASRGLGFHLGVQVLAATSTTNGAAVALGGEDGVTLVLVDRRGKVLSSRRVDTPAATGSAYAPRLARTPKGLLCVAWQQSDNHDDRLLARLHKADGAPLTAPVVLAGHVDAVANLVAHENGCRATWSGHARLPHQISTRLLSASGKPGPVRVLFQGQGRVQPLAAGSAGATHRLTFVDASRWPYRLRLKEAAGVSP